MKNKMILSLILFLGIAILFTAFALNKLRVANSSGEDASTTQDELMATPTPRPSRPES